MIQEILRRLDAVEQAIKRLRGAWDTGYEFKRLTTPRTSTNWDGDARSTTAKTRIDMETEFGVPADVKAVLVRLSVRDSGSLATSCFVGLAPSSTTDVFALVCKPHGRPNDSIEHESELVPCDENGDLWYQITATGAGTLDAWLEVWGWIR